MLHPRERSSPREIFISQEPSTHATGVNDGASSSEQILSQQVWHRSKSAVKEEVLPLLQTSYEEENKYSGVSSSSSRKKKQRGSKHRRTKSGGSSSQSREASSGQRRLKMRNREAEEWISNSDGEHAVPLQGKLSADKTSDSNYAPRCYDAASAIPPISKEHDYGRSLSASEGQNARFVGEHLLVAKNSASTLSGSALSREYVDSLLRGPSGNPGTNIHRLSHGRRHRRSPSGEHVAPLLQTSSAEEFSTEQGTTAPAASSRTGAYRRTQSDQIPPMSHILSGEEAVGLHGWKPTFNRVQYAGPERVGAKTSTWTGEDVSAGSGGMRSAQCLPRGSGFPRSAPGEQTPWARTSPKPEKSSSAQHHQSGYNRTNTGERRPPHSEEGLLGHDSTVVHRQSRSVDLTTEALLSSSREENPFGYGSIASAGQHVQRTSGYRRSKSGEDLVPLQPTLSKEDAVQKSFESQRSGIDATPSASSKPPKLTAHRRTKSGDGLPPVSPTKASSLVGGAGHRRARSASLLPSLEKKEVAIPGSRYPLPRKSQHKRNDSMSSCASISSAASVGSVRSDITKSSLFRGVTESGLIQFHLPFDNVQLVMDSGLETGIICKALSDDEDFSQYQRAPSYTNLEVLVDRGKREVCLCNCTCDSCLECGNKNRLPPVRYILAVDDDLFKRVIGEIADSKSMPCGLFFCGHHEDVHQPSICIAVTIVLLFLSLLMVATSFWAFD